MATINLLPWREELRQERKKDFLTKLALLACLIGLVCFAYSSKIVSDIDNQRARNGILVTEIDLLKKQVDEIEKMKERKRDLERRMRVIQDLEGKRSIIVHYFDQLAKNVPDGVYFTKISKVGTKVSFEGVSESNQRIATLMRNINASEWFSNPNLKSVIADTSEGSEGAQVFVMEVVVGVPGADSEENTNNG